MTERSRSDGSGGGRALVCEAGLFPSDHLAAADRWPSFSNTAAQPPYSSFRTGSSGASRAFARAMASLTNDKLWLMELLHKLLQSNG